MKSRARSGMARCRISHTGEVRAGGEPQKSSVYRQTMVRFTTCIPPRVRAAALSNIPTRNTRLFVRDHGA